jgi:hypothetical protein
MSPSRSNKLLWKLLDRIFRCFIYHMITNEHVDLTSIGIESNRKSLDCSTYVMKSKEVACQQAGNKVNYSKNSSDE